MIRQPKILIVEDEAIVALNLQQRLSHLGYAVTGTAASGDQTLALIERDVPDLVLMDIHIQGDMDGIDLAHRIGLDHSLPVIYLTAYSEDATLDRARQTRPYGYLIKPFSERELHATIQMALERHSVQLALTESQRVLSQAMNAARMGLFELEHETQTVSLTGAPAQMLGFDAAGTLGLDALLERVDPADHEMLQYVLRRGQDKPTVRALVRVRAAERARWLQIEAMALPDGRISGIASDVTERELARIEMERLNTQLEALVEHRTAELQQHIRELEAFSHTAAHDLRSPIRAISGLSQILIETKGEALGDDGQEMLFRMAGASARMGQLIESLLGLSKLSRTRPRRSEVDLSDVAQEIARTLAETEPTRAAQFDIQPGMRAHADPTLLRSVLDNLMRNAWKFSAKGSSTRIAVGQANVEGRTAFYVRDNGPGFDPGKAQRLFDPFFRLHSESEFGGSGLGLSIVQRIVERHGGRVWAESTPGEGATFWFTLGG